MGNLMSLAIGIILSLSMVLVFVEVTQVYEKQYASACCQYSYRKVTTIDKHNESETRNYCLNCKKWCSILEVKNAK